MYRERLRAVWYRVARLVLRTFCQVFFRLRVYGTENVPDEGAFILASNHQSYLDPMLCGVFLKRQLCFLARDSLFSNWFFAGLISSLGAIPLKPEQADIAAVKTVVGRLKEGRGVCLFPEATRISDGRIKPFKPGLGLLCRRGRATVVSVLIDGAFECWPRHKRMFSFGSIAVCYGEPISPERASEMGDAKLAEALTDTLRRMQREYRTTRGKEPYLY